MRDSEGFLAVPKNFRIAVRLTLILFLSAFKLRWSPSAEASFEAFW
jgi:hypothetical protein